MNGHEREWTEEAAEKSFRGIYITIFSILECFKMQISCETIDKMNSRVGTSRFLIYFLMFFARSNTFSMCSTVYGVLSK